MSKLNSVITRSDSYKAGCHYRLIIPGTTNVYAYFECRNGSKFPETPFIGLQYIIKKYFVGQVITKEKIDFAEKIFNLHFNSTNSFNRAGWEYILNKHDGYLPLRIKAVPEGTVVPVSNILMSVENTDPENCAWLTNYVESVLMKVWYPTTVAANSYSIKKMLKKHFEKTSDNMALLDYACHGFGYRAATSEDASEIGDMAHITNFSGTDTIPAIVCAIEYYNHDIDKSGIPAVSVPATEHFIQTQLGEDGEVQIIDNALNEFPDGILSMVADSFGIYRFVSDYVCKKFKDRILARNGVFVIRPDSITLKHPTPEEEMIWILQELATNLGYTINSKGYMTINPKVKVFWGDGINQDGIDKILNMMEDYKFSIDCIATFGMGGALIQKDINRDTQRTACKVSAIKRNGIWYDIFKNPLDSSKVSKKGRLSLIKEDGVYKTVQWVDGKPHKDDLLIPVFENGKLLKDWTFDEVRKNTSMN